jgi:glutamate-1-semialdehyde 2,1-aminomutase
MLGFLEGVRNIADKIGAVLIFDEVTSGFRMNLGGVHLVRNVHPDIAVFGKALGNGCPISAIIGRRAVMESAQDTFISSTFWTERIGFAAALATINKMEKNDVPTVLVRFGELINKGWNRLAQKHGLKIHISGIPPLTHIAFEYENSLAIQTLYAQEMLERGFLLGASVYTTAAYTDKIVELFLDNTDTAFGIIKKAADAGQVESSLKGEIIHAGFKRLT